MVYLLRKLGKARLALKLLYYVGLILCMFNTDVLAQNFPWGNAESTKKEAPKSNDSGTEYNSSPNTTKASASQEQLKATSISNNVQKIRRLKPGMSDYHIRHYGEKLNFDSLYQIILGPKHNYPKNYGRGKWVVYGYHPNWSGSAWKSYDFKTLSHVAYFAYEVDLTTGAPSTIYDWATTGMIEAAHADGCKVHLTVSTVSSNGSTRDMLNNAQIGQTCIDSLCYWVKKRNADGVSIDFEDMRSQDTLAFVNWAKKLKQALLKDNPKAELTIAGIASAEKSYYSLPSLEKFIDYFVIMGYDYTYAGSPNAGCTAPLPYPGSYLNLETTVDDYIKGGISAEHLVLALPYYGYKWQTEGDNSEGSINTKVIDYKGTATFRQLMQSIISSNENKFDSNSMSSYYVDSDGEEFVQTWILDSLSMSYRFDMIKQKKIAGVGMWALGFDNGESELWNLLRIKFGGIDSNAVANNGNIFEPHNDNLDIGWASIHFTKLWTVCAFSLLLLALILLISRKARAEVMNRFLLFPLIAFVGMVITVGTYEYIHDYLDWMSPDFPWIIFAGTGILVIGFYFGKSWTKNRNDDR